MPQIRYNSVLNFKRVTGRYSMHCLFAALEVCSCLVNKHLLVNKFHSYFDSFKQGFVESVKKAVEKKSVLIRKEARKFMGTGPGKTSQRL